MASEDWGTGFAKSIAVYLNGQAIPYMDLRGTRVTDASFLLCFNAHYEPMKFKAPRKKFAPHWRPIIDTATGVVGDDAKPRAASATFTVAARGLVVLEAVHD